jgi:hypothetical protein
MSNSRENFIKTINHQQTDRIVVDFGATPVTGIHVSIVEGLRAYFGLKKRPIKITEPFQMLGEVDKELVENLGVDVLGIAPKNNMFGVPQENWKSFQTNWGQKVLVPGMFNTTIDENRNTLMYPEGDTSIAPSAIMPKSSYFFDAIIRQDEIDDTKLNPEDNLEEFSLFTPEDLKYWKQQAENIAGKEKAVVANFGGTAIGDIALVPAINLKIPKGIRDVAEWYMSTVMRTDYLHQVFEKQTDIALENLKMVKETVGDLIDVVFICGTDFGTQDSTFCSGDAFKELYTPYYRKMNDWIHQNTGWKTFKHSCGAVEPFMKYFIDAGFDIINPVQINAAGMDSKLLKEQYGDELVFWGGGIDTQKTLPFGNPKEVKKQVLGQCEILSKDGGFVFNTVHNIQANVPVENIVAMLEAVQEFNKY